MGGLSTLGPLLIGVSLISLALRQIAKALKIWREWRILHTWPTAEGEVTSARVKSSAPYNDPDYTHAYQPVIRYTYTINGIPHSGTAFSDDEMWPENRAQRMVERYPLGSHITVRYDPITPRFSMLVLPDLSTIVRPFGLAGVMAVTGGVMVIISIVQLTGG
jgi:hypothetical protein